MSTSGSIGALILALCWAGVSLSLPVRGEMCSAVTRAAAGDDLTALRDKAFAAFRAGCRVRQCQPAETKFCSFVTEPKDPYTFKFVLKPLAAPFRLNFDLRTSREPLVALAENSTEESIFAEINIGGWDNTKSVIRACHSETCPTLFGGRAVHGEAGIVSGQENRPFWVEYREGVVSVGKGGQEEAFLEWDAGAYHGRVPTQVHVGIAAWKIATVHWVFYQFCV